MSFSLTQSAARAAIVGFSMIAASSFAFAAADDTIKERQACMKSNGGIMGVAVPMMKGEKPYDNAALQEAIAKMEAACANWANFWGADTQTGTAVETFAKPEIWTDTAGFEAAGGKSYTAMQALKATTDEASFKAAFPAVGAGCQGCHEKFRRPKN
jgi:cytochrome c556